MARKHENDYFAMLVGMAECAAKAAVKLEEVLENFHVDDLPRLMDELHAIEHAGDEQKHTLVQKLAKEFLPPIEREDIMAIAGKIDDVTDSVEDVLLKIYMFNIQTIHPGAVEFAKMIVRCCNELVSTMKEFANFKKSRTIGEAIIELNRLEELGDELYIKGVSELFRSGGDMLEIVAWKEVYACFEKSCDMCEHVANLVENVIMKNT